MSHIVLGVAGHVDHGKTALTYALTGVDTDRLAEEKRRGLTIESGFAPLPLPGGGLAGLVDVPGHEKLIRNMLSGASGLDAVALTIAADDGPMPQTVEHLNICVLLGVTRGLVVVTKCDLVDAVRLEAVRAAARRLTAGTFLDGAPVLDVSARTGAGLTALRGAIAALADSVPPRTSAGPFRLCVDRVFSVDGYGTVVTGTIAEGAVSVGDEVCLYPGARCVRVRALQCHGAAVDRLEAGNRAALNLAGVERSAVRPGDIAATPGTLEPVDTAEAELALLPDAPPLKTGARLRFYHGTRELLCRCTLRGQARLNPGGSCTVRLRFSEPAAVRPGDRFILRALSPAATVGGGVLMAARCSPIPEAPDERAAALLRAYHREYPLRDGMNREELVGKLGGGTILEALAERGILRLKGPVAALPGFKPRYTEALAKIRDQLEVCYRRAGLEPEENSAVDRRFGAEVTGRLVRDGVLLPLSPQYRVHRVYEARAWAVFLSLHAEEGSVTLARFRDACGASRKYALLLLEYWDRQGRTRRTGDGRAPVPGERCPCLDGSAPR